MPNFRNLFVSSTVRPNRLRDEKTKDYHLEYAKWALGTLNHSAHNWYLTKSLVNWNFYKGNQWVFGEDLQSFLMDESGEVRNRIRFVENLIRPMVEQYVGNSIRTNYTYKAVSVSENAVNRREDELSRLKFFSNVAKEAPSFKAAIEERMPVGDTDEEVEEIFQNSYIDSYEKAINGLIRYISDKNDMEDKKVIVSKHLAITGLGILKNYEKNGEYIVDVIDSLFFFWDRSAQRPDLKDAEYMGEYHNMNVTDIFEQYQGLTEEERLRIEDYSQKESADHNFINGFIGPSRGSVPVYEVYWKDTEEREYGYVMDEYDYEIFTEINSENSDFTDKDLLDPDKIESTQHKDLLGDNKKTKVYVDVLRYCVFIPGELVGGSENENSQSDDIALEFGEVSFQEADELDPSNVEFPYKCYCWGYVNGDVLSPVDDAIDPQRFLNRTLSVAESQVNNSRGSGTVFDKDMIDAQDGEEGILRDMNQSKPVFLNAKGNLNNSLGSYDNTLGGGTASLFNIVSEMRNIIQNVTGVNEAMQGTAGGERKAVGVNQMQIQRGTLIQEPFYYALGKVLEQSSQSMASVGRRIYAASQRKLPIIIGDDGAQNLIISDDMKLETFRVFVERTTDEDLQTNAGNELLVTLLQMQLIDEVHFSDGFGRSSVDDVSKALRKFQSEKLQASKKLAEQQEAQQQAVEQQVAGQEQAQAAAQAAGEDREDARAERDKAHDLDQILLKESLSKQ